MHNGRTPRPPQSDPKLVDMASRAVEINPELARGRTTAREVIDSATAFFLVALTPTGEKIASVFGPQELPTVVGIVKAWNDHAATMIVQRAMPGAGEQT